jgi:hypothetical protein
MVQSGQREDRQRYLLTPKDGAMNRFESVPATWDDVRDDAFFRIVCQLFGCSFAEAATTLLAANDTELTPA